MEHYTFTWDNEDKGEYEEFLVDNFDLETSSVLTAQKLNPPPNLNSNLEIRKISSEKEWNDVIHLQTICADPKYMNEYYARFKERQIRNYQKMSEAGIGHRFGAFLNEKLVGELGIFYEKDLGRYQNVVTHPEFRRQGICGTLVYKSGLRAFEEFKVNTLVMEADVDYHAARIYESVGFKGTEINHALTWWSGKKDTY